MECDIPEFYDVRDVVARKPRHCCECTVPINSGEQYVYCVGKWDGEFRTFSQHELCANACRSVRDLSYGECIPFGGLFDEVVSGAFDLPLNEERWDFLSMVGKIRKRQRRAALSPAKSKEG